VPPIFRLIAEQFHAPAERRPAPGAGSRSSNKQPVARRLGTDARRKMWGWTQQTLSASRPPPWRYALWRGLAGKSKRFTRV